MSVYRSNYLKIDRHGYISIYKPDHPTSKKDGYIMEHRLIWELYNNAMLLPWANVHHKNEIKSDNRIENLEAMTNGVHTKIHSKKDMSDRKCLMCYNKNTHSAYGWPQWYKHENGFICHKCYRRLCYHRRLNHTYRVARQLLT